MEVDKRFKVLVRDGYSCRNKGCKYTEEPGLKKSNLEIHHLVEKEKFKEDPELHKKLGYQMDDFINLVVLCTTCHRRYHCGVKILEINGKEYEIDKPEKFNWKAFRKEMRQMRKEYRHHWGRRVTAKEIIILLHWLYTMSV